MLYVQSLDPFTFVYHLAVSGVACVFIFKFLHPRFLLEDRKAADPSLPFCQKLKILEKYTAPKSLRSVVFWYKILRTQLPCFESVQPGN